MTDWEFWKAYFDKLTHDWTATNWIAVGAAIISVVSVVANNSSASRRDRLKSRREEFNKQITVPIEKALEIFQKISDNLWDLADSSTELSSDQVDSLLDSASKAQRTLSRALRKASSSSLCREYGWDSIDYGIYDELIETIEALRSCKAADVANLSLEAANYSEGLIENAYTRIYQELKRYV